MAGLACGSSLACPGMRAMETPFSQYVRHVIPAGSASILFEKGSRKVEEGALISKTSVQTVAKIAKALSVPMEDLVK